jgi:SAM-dependent methyltransferase
LNWAKWLWGIKARIYNRVRPGFLLKGEMEAVESLLGQISFESIKCVLDVGSGTGNSIRSLDKYTVFTVALDTSLAMLQKNSKRIFRVNGDICTVPFKPDRFELIICVGVSEYLPDLDNLLKTFYSLLTDTGYLLFTVSPGHFLNKLRFFSGHRLFLRDGNQVVKSLTENNFTLIHTMRTTIQVQYLLQKNPDRVTFSK